ncbi:MAG: hypothetical protein ACLGIA_02660 [Actinomycetes bacterium]
MSTPDSELAARTRAVLDAASGHVFGTEPGRLAAELYDVLARTTDDGDRARVAAALARCWAYGGHAARAAAFADEAVERAERTGDAQLVADCLDARLAAHWGPDELDLRTALVTRLEEVAAHVLDPEARLRAHLWALQVACERLHVQAIHRHLRALDELGTESPRARFFALSRRWMYDMLRGRSDRAPELVAGAENAGEEAGLADAWMVVHAMHGYTAMFAGDTDACARTAQEMEEFARREGVAEVAAEAAWLWTAAGRPDRVRALLGELGGAVLDGLPSDVNLLLTLQCVLEAALFVEDREIAEGAAGRLAPYEGRAVFNAGATNFHGVTDDTLARAAALAGDLARARRLRERALATYLRIGAPWWQERLRAWQPVVTPSSRPTPSFRLHPTADGVWLVGAEPGRPMRPLRGLEYLRRLVARPGSGMPAVELVTGGSGTVIQAHADTVIDRQAATAYRKRLAEIDEELAEAQQWADLGRAEQLSVERGALLDELAAASGLGGRARGTGSTHERARVAATKAIASAIERVSLVDPELGRHLRESVHTGTECSYRPTGEEVRWVLAE